MGKIKYLIICLVGILLGLSSCNQESKMIYQTLPLEKEYEAIKYVFDRNEITKEELKEMPNLKQVINSEDEFPGENLPGLDELKESDIDFQKYTLLLVYYKVPGIVEGFTYGYAKDFENDIVILSITYNLVPHSGEEAESEDLFTYCGSVILVSKISEDTEVEFRFSY